MIFIRDCCPVSMEILTGLCLIMEEKGKTKIATEEGH